jgi:hypothetical protein
MTTGPNEADLLPVDAQATFGPSFVLPITPETEPEEGPFDDVDTELDPKIREDFIGLTYLGKLEETCRVAGHTFLLRTPSQVDRLEMGPLHKPYLNTVTTEAAWRQLTVAAYLRRIDSQVAPDPLSPSITALRVRLDWVRENIYSEQVVDRLYDECLLLDSRVRDVIEALDGQGEPSA